MSRRIVLVDIGSGLTLSGVLPSVALHGSYSAKLIARGGVAPYTFTTSSHLPSGLTLDGATGMLSADDVAEAGTFALVVTVTDLSGASVTREFSLQVVPQPLTMSGHAPDGTVGTAYSYIYPAASGGVPPYTYSVLGDTPGLDFSASTRELSGVPTTTGDLSWIVRVSDSAGTILDLPDGASFVAQQGARYWRLYITKTVVDGTAVGYANVGIIGFASAVGGENMLYGMAGTATESSFYQAQYKAIFAFRQSVNDISSVGAGVGGFWHTSAQSPPYWAVYDCGVDHVISPVELILSSCNVVGRVPGDFLIQKSDDGATWETVKSFVAVKGWSAAPKQMMRFSLL